MLFDDAAHHQGQTLKVLGGPPTAHLSTLSCQMEMEGGQVVRIRLGKTWLASKRRSRIRYYRGRHRKGCRLIIRKNRKKTPPSTQRIVRTARISPTPLSALGVLRCLRCLGVLGCEGYVMDIAGQDRDSRAKFPLQPPMPT
jgi:hypothetical protein